MRAISVALAALPLVSGQVTLWGQCGGNGWTGGTTCVSGACCTYSNDWYSQCLPCKSSQQASSHSASKSSATKSTTSTAKITTSSSLVTSTKTTATTKTSTSTSATSGTFTNPVIYEDFADNDIFLGPDGAYYFSASSMHFSPGAPILKSYDLINWDFIGHSVPTLDFGDAYSMLDGTAYRRGIWASTMRYRKSTGLWYWYGCVDFWVSYVYTAPNVTGPWTRAAQFPGGTCFYDCGLLIDDDDTMYIVYGSNDVSVAQLSSDGLSINQTQQVFSTPSQFSGIEGNRMYKRNGLYYVLDDAPSNGATLIWKSTSPWGPWTEKTLIDAIPGPIAPYNSPDQGSLIETPSGDWYFMSFEWLYPSGRLPVLAPITWGDDDFPVFVSVNGSWGSSYPSPLPSHPTPAWTGTDTFQGSSLAIPWEWNHNPDTTKFSVNNGVTLSTATVTTDIFSARNTLTHRIYGALSVATVLIDFSNMADGDSCGFAAFRDWTAYIGVTRNGSSYTISNVQGALQNESSWATITDGTAVANASITAGKVWLRGTMEAAQASDHQVSFQYSTDGSNFTALGTPYTLSTDYSLFVGYRWGIFNFATKALGGSILLSSFTQA